MEGVVTKTTAEEVLEQATRLKLDKKWEAAGDLYLTLENLFPHRAYYYRHRDLEMAISCFAKDECTSGKMVAAMKQALALSIQFLESHDAAEHCKKLANHYETAKDWPNALAFMEQAVSHEEAADPVGSRFLSLQERLAKMYISCASFTKAAEVYETLAPLHMRLDNHRAMALDAASRAALCHLTHGDTVKALALVSHAQAAYSVPDARNVELLLASSLAGFVGQIPHDLDAFDSLVATCKSIVLYFDASLWLIITGIRLWYHGDEVLQ